MIDIRNYGLMGAVEYSAHPGGTSRGMDIYNRCFKKGLLLRPVGNTNAFAPPLIVEKHHLDKMFNIIREAIVESDAALK